MSGIVTPFDEPGSVVGSSASFGQGMRRQGRAEPTQTSPLLAEIRTGRQRLLAGRIARGDIIAAKVGGAEGHVPPRQHSTIVAALLAGREQPVMRPVEARREQ